VYVLFGMVVAGFIRVFFGPSAVGRHLGRGKVLSVVKAALLGIPIPLCSCGVLPAAASLKKQGANNGATMAFLISTPESGVDSMALTYALLDPVMTVARPVAAFFTAGAAGLLENLFAPDRPEARMAPDLSCPVDGCCDGVDCPPEEHRRHHSVVEKIRIGLGFALGELWGDIASWFFVGLVLAGVITALVPDSMVNRYLGGGIHAMLIMLVIGIPLYICASGSTPIAAALILKGVSPGAALVFLLVGPATNMTSLTVIVKILGKRGAAFYLASIALCGMIFGLVLDQVYPALGILPHAVAGRAAEIVPGWVQTVGACVLLGFSVRPLSRTVRKRVGLGNKGAHAGKERCV